MNKLQHKIWHNHWSFTHLTLGSLHIQNKVSTFVLCPVARMNKSSFSILLCTEIICVIQRPGSYMGLFWIPNNLSANLWHPVTVACNPRLIATIIDLSLVHEKPVTSPVNNMVSCQGTSFSLSGPRGQPEYLCCQVSSMKYKGINLQFIHVQSPVILRTN